jgi:hypothetical protein
MNRKLLINFLIGNGIVSSVTGNKINELIAKLLNLKPTYVPVPVRVKSQNNIPGSR